MLLPHPQGKAATISITSSAACVGGWPTVEPKELD